MLSKHSGISAVPVIFYDRDSIRSPSTVLAATNCTSPIALLPSVPRRDPSNAVLDQETMTMRTHVRQNDVSHFVGWCDDPTPEVRVLPQYNLRNAQPLFVFLVYFMSNNRRERSFLLSTTTPKPISFANETHPTCACNPHCLHSLVCTGASAANRHPCFVFLLNLSSISSLFRLRSIPKKMSYVLLYLFMYKFSLLQGKPLSKRHIIVVAGLSASDLLGFLASPQMFALAVFTLHQVLGVILLAVSLSDKPSLAIYWFPLVGKYSVLSNSAGLLQPHSLTPITPFSPNTTLSFLVSSLRRLSFLPSWLRSYGVEFQLHHIKIFLP